MYHFDSVTFVNNFIHPCSGENLWYSAVMYCNKCINKSWCDRMETGNCDLELGFQKKLCKDIEEMNEPPDRNIQIAGFYKSIGINPMKMEPESNFLASKHSMAASTMYIGAQFNQTPVGIKRLESFVSDFVGAFSK